MTRFAGKRPPATIFILSGRNVDYARSLSLLALKAGLHRGLLLSPLV